MALHLYDPAKVLIVFAGGGVGKGGTTFLTVEQNEDSWQLFVGIDGETARARNQNRSGKITVRTIQASIINDLWSAFANVDRLSPGGDGISPLLIKDGSGRTLVVAEHAWITKQADVEFGREASEREWVIEA